MFGALTVDVDGRQVFVSGEPVMLTRTEFDVLAALSSRPAIVFSRRQLLEAIWGESWVGNEHLIDVHVGHLRRKLGDNAAETAPVLPRGRWVTPRQGRSRTTGDRHAARRRNRMAYPAKQPEKAASPRHLRTSLPGWSPGVLPARRHRAVDCPAGARLPRGRTCVTKPGLIRTSTKRFTGAPESWRIRRPH